MAQFVFMKNSAYFTTSLIRDILQVKAMPSCTIVKYSRLREVGTLPFTEFEQNNAVLSNLGPRFSTALLYKWTSVICLQMLKWTEGFLLSYLFLLHYHVVILTRIWTRTGKTSNSHTRNSTQKTYISKGTHISMS